MSAESSVRVSVIIPAYNAMPELTRCVTSAREQTIGLDRLEIIAVNDGSTDGTAEELDRLAADCPALRVIHQENSGGAGGPRNTGLDHARGDFVFFLDSDDYLGPDALRRMVAMADENGTDIVLGRIASVGGRAVPRAVFQHNQPRTDIFSSHAYLTLGPWKLFRRSLIERLHLRFPPYRNCEDKPFTAAAYLNASGISVVADYDCYYVRYRENRSNLTLIAGDLVHRMDGIRLCFETVARYLEPGPRRDQIMRRHVEWELCGPLRGLLPRENEKDARERFFPEFRHWARTWVTDTIVQRIDAPDRLLIHLLRADRFEDVLTVARNAKRDARCGHLIDKGRVYWLHPFFRDHTADVPDACFDITDRLPVRHHLETARWHGGVLRLTGHAYIEDVDALEPATEVVLRKYQSERPEVRVPTTPCRAARPLPGEGRYEQSGFSAEFDPATVDDGAPLERGLWNIYLDVRAQGVSRTVRFGNSREDGETTHPPRRELTTPEGEPLVVVPYFTPYGNVSLDVGQVAHPLDAPCQVTRTAWHPVRKSTLVVGGRLADDVARDGRRLRLRAENGAGAVREIPVRYGPGGSRDFTARLPVGRLGEGRWTLALIMESPDGEGPYRTAIVPRFGRLAGTRWFRFGRPYYAKPVAQGPAAALGLEVAPVKVATGVRRRLRRGWARLTG
ncbi:glycosyltransferase family 2 protein [Streptomyces coffeae]|uniref:Glycosyltransferase family 2 protein n=1 Tax=Streptomyces coffeae TaxID=621382 RepID=A0ABS1NHH5_9ACTN|nr:glycosyltransferase family 2 protein [Streptomyces coffeae]MBL1099531.1 glycosyltransferase family 2 protein [Streptomyces coffeae]